MLNTVVNSALKSPLLTRRNSICTWLLTLPAASIELLNRVHVSSHKALRLTC